MWEIRWYLGKQWNYCSEYHFGVLKSVFTQNKLFCRRMQVDLKLYASWFILNSSLDGCMFILISKLYCSMNVKHDVTVNVWSVTA